MARSRWHPSSVDVPLDEAITLLVATSSRKSPSGYVVGLRHDAEEILRQAVARTVESINSGSEVAFGPDVYVEDGEYMAVPSEIVGDHIVLDLLSNSGNLDQLPPNE